MNTNVPNIYFCDIDKLYKLYRQKIILKTYTLDQSMFIICQNNKKSKSQEKYTYKINKTRQHFKNSIYPRK